MIFNWQERRCFICCKGIRKDGEIHLNFLFGLLRHILKANNDVIYDESVPTDFASRSWRFVKSIMFNRLI